MRISVRQIYFIRALFLVIALSFFPGCINSRHIKSTGTVPDWVKKVPREKGRLCAVGASEPTYYIEDGKTYAAENARRELARTLHVNVKSLMVDITTEKGGDIAEGGTVEVVEWASETVLQQSEITAYWYDEHGIATFEKKGIIYALACMPFESR